MAKPTKRADGRYMLRFTVEGKRYAVYGSTAKECRQKELDKRQEIAEGLTGSAKRLTVEQWLIRWLDARAGRLSGSSIRTNNQHLRRACRQDIKGHRFGNIKLVKLEAGHVRDLQSVLSEQFTTRTTNDTISFLKQGIEAAVNERVISWNPCNAVESLKRVEAPARDTVHRCLSREEVAAFMDEAKNSHYYGLYQFLLNTGLRLGEAGAITPADVRGGNVQIEKTVTREESGYCIRKQTKTEAGRRSVPLNDQARTILKDEMSDITVRMDKPIFTTVNGSLLISSVISEDINRICKRSGIERFTAHAFRATFISRCVADGMPIKDLMEICGHKDVAMTLGLYSHSNDESRAESLRKVAIV